MSSWYEQLRTKTDYILEAIKQQDFIQKLMDGSLPKEVFHFYINQDALYLSEYKKVLSLVGIKCKTTEDIQFFLDAATGILAVENALHQSFMGDDHALNSEPSPTCELYVSYLTRIAANGSVEEGLAAVLPCFTIYKEIGDWILENQSNKENNPYQNWINTYGGEAFAKSVEQAVAITNKHAANATPEQLKNMEAAFIKASKLEWMFWDSAYNQEAWKI